MNNHQIIQQYMFHQVLFPWFSMFACTGACVCLLFRKQCCFQRQADYYAFFLFSFSPSAEPQHDVLSCARPNHVLHYPLGPFTHTITLSLDQQIRQSGSTSVEGNATRIQQPCRVSLVGCDDCLLQVSIK